MGFQVGPNLGREYTLTLTRWLSIHQPPIPTELAAGRDLTSQTCSSQTLTSKQT